METPFEIEPEAPEIDEALPSATPVGTAMAMRRGSRDKSVNARTAAFLEEQTAVLRLQKEHLHEQRELQLSHMRWRQFSDRMKAGLQLVSVVVVLAVVGALGAEVWAAARADSVVVDSFQSPPSLAARGDSGMVVAAGLLDELRRLQAATRSARVRRGVKDAWSGDIRAEVPETGVSIGELVRDLHRWLGHETHVGGDLVQTDAGLRLTVRGDGFQAKSFEGPAADLPRLLAQAAEYVYGEAEPYLAASYLSTHGRIAESIRLAQSKYGSASPAERPFLLNVWGNGLSVSGQDREALALYEQAVKLKPDYWVPYANILSSLYTLGREEDVWRRGREFERIAGRGQPGQKAPEVYFTAVDAVVHDLPAWRAGFIADMEAHGGIGTQTSQDGPNIADISAQMHDWTAARLYLQTSADAATDPWVAAMAHMVRGRAALEAGLWSRAAGELEAFAAANSDSAISSEVPGYVCWLAPAEEMAGRPDKADAVLNANAQFVDCARFRGDVLDHRGDWPGAQKAYAAAVALAPDLPAPFYSWGLALARHGDLGGAVAKYAAANRRGPHWADPLKAWGDALAAQGRWTEAAAKYAEAASYAPSWKLLRYAGGESLRRQGKYAAAIAQYRLASG